MSVSVLASESVASRLESIRGKLALNREKASNCFNRFAAESEVKAAMQEKNSPSTTLRETLIRIKGSVREANAPTAPSPSGMQSNQKHSVA